MKPLFLLTLPAAAQPADSPSARLNRVVDAAHAAGAFDGVVLSRTYVSTGFSADLVRAALQSGE